MPMSITLPGPAPWGFRITGGRDFGKPITVSKVTEQGKAAMGDLRPGDIIVTINGESAAEMLNVEAQNKIKQSPGQLRLQVERSPVPPPSHTNGDTSPRPATRFQDVLWMQEETPGACRGSSSTSCSPVPGSGGSQLMEDITCPGLCQEQGSLNSSLGSALPPPPRPPSPGLGAPPDPWEPPGGGRSSACSSPGSERAMRRPEEDSEVRRMLQQSREPRAPPQSGSFRLLQEALRDEPGAPVPTARRAASAAPRLPPCEKCGSGIATQAVRIRDGRYRHPSCYACADCGLNLKMRGHFWAGDELYCEKHAKLRYQGPPAVPPHC
ncbi:PDZ and LIM domain protein 2 isoform X1 [Melopsittacus undulatus]|uniref:PDZ and LIM domain protein 2 isoform X1 n=1 Tax=Melopsittacus undulatus TaxID=13146 RepID=UPI00146CECE4|nr:PDZ and LIM domain protein 2 isoform X1 [Melopsittacus undulatus]XP_033926497.1 PDZ and LIM domain protein 2 isoform X1 [Melopsittacus undulatus]XP_033926498.1 PDZ and LIM domain protein 2 isoform X1 [Melopsittacus undulatus]XP_033926500.1 PDZ and LIM domain protein 2 isoform X1 [Melopsittacus undulatus]